MEFERDRQYGKFCLYGFLKNLRFFDPYLVLFFRELNFTFLEIGLLFSVRAVATGILEIPLGVAADVVGRRRSMIFSYGCYILSFLVFFFFSRFFVYLGAMVLFALGEAFRSGTHKAMILDYLKGRGWEKWKVHYYGRTRSWSQWGSALSSLLAALLVFYGDSFRVVFAYTVIPYLLGLLLFITYPRELEGKQADGLTSPGRTNPLTPWKEVFLALAALPKNPGARRAFLSSSLFDGFFKAQKDYIQPVIQSLALGLPLLLGFGSRERVALITGGLYFLLYTSTACITGKTGTLASRLRSLPRAMNLTYLAGVICLLAIGLTYRFGPPALAVVFFILYYMLENLRRPIALGYVTEKIKNRIMAAALSGEAQLKTLFVAVFAPLSGFLADKVGLGLTLFMAGIAAALLYPLIRVRSVEAVG